MTTITWYTAGPNLGQFLEGKPVDLQLTTITDDNTAITYSLISGSMPAGILEDPVTILPSGRITGTPAEVDTEITSTFTIRAQSSSGAFQDKTFSMEITGMDPPEFFTPTGTLAYITDGVYLRYQLEYTDPDPSTWTRWRVKSGELPPGIEFNSGLISGYADPPVDEYENPTTKTWEFVIELETASGITSRMFSITVVNFYVNNPIPSQNARPPVLLNLEPLKESKTIESDVYYGYYTDSTGYIGTLKHDDEWVYKLAGYDFEGQTSFIYTCVGLDIINQAGQGDGSLSLNSSTGWITGKLPNIGGAKFDFYLTATATKIVPQGELNAIKTIVRGSPTRITTFRDHDIASTNQITMLNNSIGFNNQQWYAKVIDSKTIDLYLNQALTKPVNTSLFDQPVLLGTIQRNEYRRSSSLYEYKLTLLGNLDPTFTWHQDSDLGTIYNGDTSHLSIRATTPNTGYQVNYRIVSERQENFNAIIQARAGTAVNDSTAIPDYYIVGDLGVFARSRDLGNTLEYYTQFSRDKMTALATGTVVEAGVNRGLVVAVGYNQAGYPRIFRTDDGENWIPAAAVGNSRLYSVIHDDRLAGERYIAVGENAQVITSSRNAFLWFTSSMTGIADSSVTVFRDLLVTDYLEQDSSLVIKTISKASPCVIEFKQDHSLVTGDKIIVHDVEGMTELNGNQYWVKYLTSTQVELYTDNAQTLAVNSSTYSTYEKSGWVELDYHYFYTVVGNVAQGQAGIWYVKDKTGKFPDALQWSEAVIVNPTLALTNPIRSVICHEVRNPITNQVESKRFVAVGNSGLMLDSSDGITWTEHVPITTENILDVVWDNDQFYIVGADGFTAYSDLGTNNSWSYKTSNQANDLTSIIYGDTLPDSDYSIGLIRLTNPCEIVFEKTHEFQDGQRVIVRNIKGTTELNHRQFWIEKLDGETIALYADSLRTQPIDAQGYTSYVSGGGVSAVKYNAVAVGHGSTLLYGKSILLYNPRAFTEEFDEFNYDITYYDQNAKYIDTWVTPTLGELCPNLTLLTTGEISGRVVFETTRSTLALETGQSQRYSFWAQAYIVGQEEITSVKQFYLTATKKYSTPYETIYIQAFPSLRERRMLDTLFDPVQDNEALDPIPDNWVYRLKDPYYGRAKRIIYYHSYGVRADVRDKYIQAIEQNHYWRDLVIGPPTAAIARNSAGSVLYEVIYCPIIDNLVNSNNQSISQRVSWPRRINLHRGPWMTSMTNVWDSFIHADNKNYYQSGSSSADYPKYQDFMTSLSPGFTTAVYPASLENMRLRVNQILGNINDDRVLPLWMTTQQLDGNTLGFTPAWVICYLQPGYTNQVLTKLETWQQNNLRFNEIRFNVDRFLVDKQLTFDWDGNTWLSTLPSSQPGVTDNSEDETIIMLNQSNILPYRAPLG